MFHRVEVDESHEKLSIDCTFDAMPKAINLNQLRRSFDKVGRLMWFYRGGLPLIHMSGRIGDDFVEVYIALSDVNPDEAEGDDPIEGADAEENTP